MKIKFKDASESLVAVKADGTEVDILSRLDFVYKFIVGKRVVAKINVTDTSSATKIMGSTSVFCGVIIDDVVQPSIVGSYVFSTTGEHTIQYILANDTSIGKSAFHNCSSLTSVTIPSSVTSIGDNVFQGCSSLTSINIPSGVTSIGAYTFYGCFSLTSITIPSGVTRIGFDAFNGCSGLTSITVNATTPPSLDFYVFNSTNNCPIYVPSGSVDIYKAATSWSSYASRIQAIP